VGVLERVSAGEGCPMNALTERAISIALTQVGVREERRNRGKVIDGYSRDIGRDPEKADPWCAIFVCAMFRRAADQLGIRCPVPLTAGCWTLDERSPKTVRTTEATPGAIFLLKGHRHTGIVVEALGGELLRTVEGNTDPGGSREGDGVYDRTRRRSEIEVYLDFGRIDLATLAPG
jgi:hypothetical protein